MPSWVCRSSLAWARSNARCARSRRSCAWPKYACTGRVVLSRHAEGCACASTRVAQRWMMTRAARRRRSSSRCCVSRGCTSCVCTCGSGTTYHSYPPIHTLPFTPYCSHPTIHTPPFTPNHNRQQFARFHHSQVRAAGEELARRGQRQARPVPQAEPRRRQAGEPQARLEQRVGGGLL
jgi:hypothetical protein